MGSSGAGRRIDVLAPDGTPGTISEEELDGALASGFTAPGMPAKIDPAQEFHGGNEGLSFATGALSGATSGLSDVAFGKGASPLVSALAKGAKTASPNIHAVGQLAGTFVAPTTSLIGGVGHATKAAVGAQTAMGRVGASALAGGVEGSLFGAGAVVSEYGMGDPDLNAQKILATVGLGGVLGLAAGGAVGLLTEGARVAAPAITKALADAQKSVEEFRNTRAIKATGAIQSDINRLSDQRLQQIGQDIYEAGFTKGAPNAREILEKTKKGARDQWSLVEKTLKAADDTAEKAFDIKKVVDRARSEVLAKIEGDPSLAADARKLKRIIDGYEKLGDGVGFANAQKLDSNLRKSLKKVMASDAEKDAVTELRGIFRSELGDQLKTAVGAEAAATFEGAMRKYGSFAEAKKWGIRGIKRMDGNSFFSLSDRLGGGLMGVLAGGPAGVAAAGASMVAGKVTRERGASVVANIAGAIAESPTLKTISEHFAKHITKAPSGSLGHYSAEMANAVARSPAEALATHIHLSRTAPGYAEAAALAGLPQTAQHEAVAAVSKANGIGRIQHVLDGHDDKLASAIEKTLHKGGEHAAHAEGQEKAAHRITAVATSVARSRRTPAETHASRVEQVAAMAANPQMLVDRVAPGLVGLGAHAPAMSAAVSAAASRGIAFLASKAETPPKAGPLAPQWTPSAAEISKFDRYYKAVDNPMTIIDEMESGTVSPETLETLKTVYPSLYQDIQRNIIEALADEPEDVPYSRRVMLSLVAGVDADGTMNKASIQASQAVFNRPSAKGPEDRAGGGAVRPSQAGASKLNIAGRSLTSMQATTQRNER